MLLACRPNLDGNKLYESCSVTVTVSLTEMFKHTSGILSTYGSVSSLLDHKLYTVSLCRKALNITFTGSNPLFKHKQLYPFLCFK
jgi:hypothetical protein